MEIQDYPNYLIHPDGRVENKKTGRILKPGNNNGYLVVGLRNNGKTYTKKIHRLIGIRYIPNPNNYLEIDHIDRNKQNNNIDNLKWVTRSQNNQNTGKQKNNTTGIKNICLDTKNNKWCYNKFHNGIRYTFSNTNKQLVLWVKFIHSLSVKQLN